MERINEICPDAILLDIMLPYKDGWEILSELKNDNRTKNIPVIMASVLSEKNLAYRMKADEYLIKPVTREELVETIMRTIRKKQGIDVLVGDDDENFLNRSNHQNSIPQISVMRWSFWCVLKLNNPFGKSYRFSVGFSLEGLIKKYTRCPFYLR